MKTFKRLDVVKLKNHPKKDDINHKAIVQDVDIKNKRLLISNTNMPFMGTYNLTWVSFNDVEK